MEATASDFNAPTMHNMKVQKIIAKIAVSLIMLTRWINKLNVMAVPDPALQNAIDPITVAGIETIRESKTNHFIISSANIWPFDIVLSLINGVAKKLIHF
jgi:hypothetical protein